MLRQCWGILLVSLVACAGEPEGRRPAEPPAGGVDPADVTAESLGTAQKPSAGPPPPSAPARGDDMSFPLPQPLPEPAPVDTSKPDAAPGGGKGPMIMMTAETCRELGKKFSRLTAATGAPQPMADKIGADFASKCIKDEAGQMVDRREYDCVMAAKSVNDVPGCQTR